MRLALGRFRPYVMIKIIASNSSMRHHIGIGQRRFQREFGHMIAAITFDFWDTIAIDGSDEPKRAALGLPSKADARIDLFATQVMANHPHITYAQAEAAYRWADQRFSAEWHDRHRTPGVTTRFYDAYEYLGLLPERGYLSRLAGKVDRLVRNIEAMEVRIPPDFAPGVHGTIATLAKDYSLGIISDTIHTHGRGLRHLLQQQDLLRYFSHFIFSDEVGAAKPSVKVFRQAILGLDTPAHEMVHVGDREANDVCGPRSIGMRTVLYTGIIDRGSTRTQAHRVCRHFRELPAIIEQLR